MKSGFPKVHFLVVPIIVFGLALAESALAQTYNVLHYFDNLDGSTPLPGLVLSSNTLFGVTLHGGYGTVFKVNTDGTGFTTLHRFTGGSDSGNPNGRLLLSGNALYGTTLGTVFALTMDGTGFTNLHVFSDLDITNGLEPQDGLVLSSNTLYGTTLFGGSLRYGTVFEVNTDGSGFTNIHSFTGSEGEYPNAGLVLSGNMLYGVAQNGGSAGNGTVFSLKIDGAATTVLYNFSSTTFRTNSDGVNPEGDLLLSGDTLYGTTPQGGISNAGTIFALKVDGTAFRTLHQFTLSGTDGGWPASGLILSGNTLYGTVWSGASGDNGTVFSLNTDGTGFTTIHAFSTAYPPQVANPTNTDGAEPWGTPVQSGNKVYGTTLRGGIYGFGTVFSISFAPQLRLALSETNLVLSWPTNYAGFDYTGYSLQLNTNLASSLWSTNLPVPAVVNGLNVVTNPVSGAQQFFRLSR